MKFENKVAVITGGGGSIGGAIARKLAAQGASVALADMNLGQARKVAGDIESAGGRALPLTVNVCDRDSIKEMVAIVREQLGEIDILVNNAGGSARGECSLFHQTKDEVVDRIIDVNLKGSIYCIRAVVEQMVARRSGKIINIGSIVGMQGLAYCADYSAAKGGIIAITKTLAMELGEFGINVNCVSPGLVPRPDQDGEAMRKTNYLRRICSANDIANTVVFLLSSEADFITGQNYVVDGGRSLGLLKRVE
ncbi:SDR family oxidoreductase [Ruficoccus amylovorans]|uniref:SDR family oxidoreductase n=1 Tax=Ruficoccus amylovorans TaxID=1804625 RepID=A0A842HK47_9BACT|nr:SDR family oxidoreductase [Ruficoccus amylovorans]MBC2595857.1 SDR family oxidoreductase [Ruficoccus amylovorans]